MLQRLGFHISQKAMALAGYELMIPLDASRYPSQPSRYLLEPLLCLDAVFIFPGGISCHHIPGFLLL